VPYFSAFCRDVAGNSRREIGVFHWQGHFEKPDPTPGYKSGADFFGILRWGGQGRTACA